MFIFIWKMKVETECPVINLSGYVGFFWWIWLLTEYTDCNLWFLLSHKDFWTKNEFNYSFLSAELELRLRDSWITNQFCDPKNQKFVKLPSFSRRYLSVYQPRVKWMRLNDGRKKVCTMFWLVLNLLALNAFTS